MIKNIEMFLNVFLSIVFILSAATGQSTTRLLQDLRNDIKSLENTLLEGMQKRNEKMRERKNAENYLESLDFQNVQHCHYSRQFNYSVRHLNERQKIMGSRLVSTTVNIIIEIPMHMCRQALYLFVRCFSPITSSEDSSVMIDYMYISFSAYDGLSRQITCIYPSMPINMYNISAMSSNIKCMCRSLENQSKGRVQQPSPQFFAEYT